MERNPCVYVLANKPRGTLYVGVTSNLTQRVWQHKNNVVEGFTCDYDIHDLVWYERHDSMEAAIMREKRIKNWKRMWKIQLVENANPEWHDLYDTLF